MDVSIIVTSRNKRELLRRCLESVYASKTSYDFEVIVVDNDSKDGSQKMLDESYPSAEVVENFYDNGFSRSCNQGIKLANGRFLILIDARLRLEADTLEEVIGWMVKNRNAAIVTCPIGVDGDRNLRNYYPFPTLANQLVSLFGFGKYNQRYVDGLADKPFKADCISSIFFCVDTENTKKPPFWLDERYSFSFSDFDYCRKVSGSGGEIWFLPEAKCYFEGNFPGYMPHNINGIRSYAESMLKYFLKWQPIWQYWVLRAVWPFVIGLTYVLQSLKIRKKKVVN